MPMRSAAALFAVVSIQKPLLMVLMGARILALMTLVSGLLLRAGMRRGLLRPKPKSPATVIFGAGKPLVKPTPHRKGALHFSS
jgi:hypothetical protein